MMRGVPLVNDLLFYNGFEECCWMAKSVLVVPKPEERAPF